MRKPKPLKDRLRPAMLEKLRTRKMTNAEAAAILEVSETYLSRTVAAMQDKTPGETVLDRKAQHKLAQARKQKREQVAKRVISGNLGLAAAARQANCSERTVNRWIAAYSAPRRAPKKAATR